MGRFVWLLVQINPWVKREEETEWPSYFLRQHSLQPMLTLIIHHDKTHYQGSWMWKKSWTWRINSHIKAGFRHGNSTGKIKCNISLFKWAGTCCWIVCPVKRSLCHLDRPTQGVSDTGSQTLTWISCISVHPVCTRNTDRNYSYTSSREMLAWRGSVLPNQPHQAQWQQWVLCLWAILLMGIHISIRYESAYRGGLVLTHKQVPHQQRGKSCLLWQ